MSLADGIILICVLAAVIGGIGYSVYRKPWQGLLFRRLRTVRRMHAGLPCRCKKDSQRFGHTALSRRKP